MPKVTLTKPGTGSTQWGTNVGQNWTDVENTFKQSMYQREVFEIVAEFLNSLNGTPFTAAASGKDAAADTNVTGEAGHPGIDQLGTGTDTTGRAAIQTALDCILLGGGALVLEAVVRIPTLPDGTDSFDFRIGLGNRVNGDFGDGAYFELTEADTEWQCKTADSSSRTTSDSGVTAQADTWTRLRIEVNAGGTEVKFYIDGSLAATHSTNIPTGAGEETGIVASIIKSNGTTERTAQIDYVYASIEFTTAR